MREEVCPSTYSGLLIFTLLPLVAHYFPRFPRRSLSRSSRVSGLLQSTPGRRTPVTEFNNSTLMQMTARKLNLTADGATSVLLSRVAVPTRGNKGKAVAWWPTAI